MERIRRSALYLPGSNPRAIEKSRTLDCDVVIFDLEDAVAPDAKATARNLVATELSSPGRASDTRSQERVLRINGTSTPWYEDDVRMAAQSGTQAILLPKAESPEQIQQLASKLHAAGASPDIELWCLLETPLGVLRSESIASAHPKLTCIVMGTSDLTQDLRALHTSLRLPMLTSLGLCLLAARAHRLSILDGVSLDLADEPGFAAACTQSRELGFDGKTLIHPKQIAPCNEAFSPSTAEVERAKATIAAYDLARSEGRGVVVHQGRLVEELHVREAQRIIATYDSILGRQSHQSV